MLDGDHAPPPQKGAEPLPNFRPISIVAKRLDALRKMPLSMDVGLSPGDFVLDGDQSSLPNKGGEALSQFSAYLYCGQTAGWMKLALGMEVGLSPGDCVRWGPSPPPQKGSELPAQF